MLKNIARYPVTYGLIIINTIIYLISASISHNFLDMNTQVLFDMGATYGPKILLDGEWWRLFSAMFLHAGIIHLSMNMYSLYIVGKGVDSYFTSLQYLVIYLFSGIFGTLLSLSVHSDTLGVGASGAIFGLLGALAGFFLVHKKEIAKQSRAFFGTFGSVIALNLFIGLSVPNIDMSAHIGGLIAGFLGGYLISKNSKNIWIYIILSIFIILGIIRYL